jgi:hypothetical protein
MPVHYHPRILAAFATAVLGASVSVAYAGQATDVPKSKPPQPPLQILQGCINGSIISSIQVDEQSSPMELPIGATLRVAGSKEMVRVLKTEHNGHLLELTGKMKGSFGPPTQTTTKAFGKLSVGVGGAQAAGPNTPGVPSMPSFEVRSFKFVADCGERTLPR